VVLGISTLLLYVPVSLGSAHQAGALTLMSLAVASLHSLRGAGAAAARSAVGGGAVASTSASVSSSAAAAATPGFAASAARAAKMKV
jgi:hypothetical protein